MRDIPVEVRLDESDGLPSRCMANLDDMASIPKTPIRRRIAVLSVQKMREVAVGVRFALDLP